MRDVRSFWVGLLSFVLSGSGGCMHEQPALDAGSDAPILLPRSPDGLGYCCPAPTFAMCGCFPLGGFTTSGFCGSTCDGADFRRETDGHGCAVLRPYGSCLPRPDVPDDTGITENDAGVFDADATGELDAPSDIDAFATDVSG